MNLKLGLTETNHLAFGAMENVRLQSLVGPLGIAWVNVIM
jgi:hypothetical protein